MAWQYPWARLSLLQGLDAAHHLPAQSPGRLPAPMTLSKTSLSIYSSAAQDDTWPQPQSHQESLLRDTTLFTERVARLAGKPLMGSCQARVSGRSGSAAPRGVAPGVLRPFPAGTRGKAGGRPMVS